MVVTAVNYSEPPKDGEVLFRYATGPGRKPSHTNHVPVPTEVQITDLAEGNLGFTPSVPKNGFQLANFEVDDSNINWDDHNEAAKAYWPALEALLKRELGASRVIVFDHTTRKGNIDTDINKVLDRNAEGKRPPIPYVHVDFSARSGIERLKELPKPAVQPSPEEVSRLQKTPFAIIQVWRPFKTVDEAPLAMIDASTVAKEDLLPNKLDLPGRIGWTYSIAANPNHKFYYHKGLKPNQALLFVCYDSRADRARFTPHTGFKDPTTTPGAPERESVEARAYVFWENEEAREPEPDWEPASIYLASEQ